MKDNKKQTSLSHKIISTVDFKDIKLRDVIEDDLELIMAWRSNPQTYKYFYVQDSPLRWEEHIAFWESRKERKDWIILFKQNRKWRKVGSVNACNLSDNYPEVGVFIGEITLWGKGLGKKAVGLILNWLHKNGYNGAKAKVSKENKSAQKLFEGCNFLRQKSIRNGKEWLYLVNFSNEKLQRIKKRIK